MSTETSITILTITLAINSFLLGIYFGLTGWPQLKKRSHTDIKAQAWEDGFTQGAAYYNDTDHPPTAYTETAQSLNPHKENN